MPRDIRELRGDPEAYAAELRRRWGGLLSYRYLGRSYASMDDGDLDDTVVLRRDMRDPTGGVLLAVLGTCSPEGGGVSDLEAVPNPVVRNTALRALPDAPGWATSTSKRALGMTRSLSFMSGAFPAARPTATPSLATIWSGIGVSVPSSAISTSSSW